MRPVLFSVFGLDIQSYGASKALAALVAAFMLARAFEQRGFKRDSAYSLVMWATIWGFVGAKIYYLLEQLPNVDLHHLGGMGFTWYGGLIGGVMASLVIVRRHQLPLGAVSGAIPVPSPSPMASAFPAGEGHRPANKGWFAAGADADGRSRSARCRHRIRTPSSSVIAVVLWRLGKRA